MPCLCLRLLLLAAATVGTHCTDFNVLWMAPRSNYEGLEAGSSAGALKLAIDDIQASSSDTFNVSYVDSDCSSKVALAALYDKLIKEKRTIDVIIGPPCSTAMTFVAQVAGYRGIPVIGWVSDSPDFGDKQTYNTLIRVLPPINVIVRGMEQILQTYSWKRVFLLSSSGYPYQQLGAAVNELLKALKPQGYMETRWKDRQPLDADVSTISDIYKTARKEARIFILSVPYTSLRQWMIQAEVDGLIEDGFVFIYLNGELATDDVIAKLKSEKIWRRGDSDDNKARRGFESLIILTPKSYHPNSSFITEADQKGKSYCSELGLTHTATDSYAPYLYDALRVYHYLADTATSYTNGSELFTLANKLYQDDSDYKTSPILLDGNSDRVPDFWLLDLSPDGAFVEADAVESTLNASDMLVTTVRHIRPVIWADGSNGVSNAPPDVPVCGFSNEFCQKANLVLYIVPPVVITLLILIALVAYFVNRKLQFERSLKDMGWKLNPDDLKKTKSKDHLTIMLAGSRASSIQKSRASGIGSHHTETRSLSRTSVSRKSGSHSMLTSSGDEHSQIFVNVVKYKGAMVAVKKIRKQRIKIDRALLVEMRAMVNLKNHSLAQFVGATTEPPEILEVWEYCSKGSLQDVIWNENIRLEEMFKFSIAIDIFKGLKYLHDSPIKIHGRLKSSNCVLDGRWTCKLTDYGLFRIREGAEDDPDLTEFAKCSRLLWMAPEFLRQVETGSLVTAVSQEADIYAAAIILKEIFARNGPYTEYEDDMEPNEILDKIKLIPDGTFLPFRPSLAEVKGRAPDKLIEVIKRGWSEKPSDRPSPGHVVKDLQRINPNKTSNVMDNMIKMMERYTNHLEEVVNERTQQVEEEKKKSEMLLYRMLPRPIAEALKKGSTVEAESYDNVSLYFSDIVQFTALSAQSTPMQVVDLLNGLYTMFDSAIANHDVYKVETIGDAYMLVSGLPQRNGDRHAVEIANCAMDLLSGILGFKVAHMPEDYVLRIRIGLHTGPTVAGVVGLTMPRYCLFGNTITIAQTMESGGQPMRIQMSQNTYDILKTFSGYYLAARNAPIDIKGFGKTNTYWLINKEGYTKPMPDFKALSADDDPQPSILPVTTGRTFRPSVTESGIFDLDTDDREQTRRTSSVGPDLEHISEKSHESLARDSREPEVVRKNGEEVISPPDGSTDDQTKTPEELRDPTEKVEEQNKGSKEQKGQEQKEQEEENAKGLEEERKDNEQGQHEEANKGITSGANGSREATSTGQSWAKSGRAAILVTPSDNSEQSRPSTAALRKKFRIMSARSKPDLLLEEMNFGDEDL